MSIHPIIDAAKHLALEDSDLEKLKVAPNYEFFPFIDLVQKIVGGLWALGLYVAVGAWIVSALVWIASKAIHNSQMQQYSGIVFVWIALGTMVLGSSMTIVKYFAVQPLF